MMLERELLAARSRESWKSSVHFVYLSSLSTLAWYDDAAMDDEAACDDWAAVYGPGPPSWNLRVPPWNKLW